MADINLEWLERAIDDADLQEDARVTIHVDYSGRGMFGDQCLGISAVNQGCVFAVLSELLDLIRGQERDEHDPPYRGLLESPDFGEDDIRAMFRSYEHDSYGHETIVYWRGTNCWDGDRDS